MIEETRIKLVFTRDGDNIICDLQEAVDKETGKRQAYIMTIPYKVWIIDQPESQVDLETFEDQEVKIRYTPWNPFTIDQKIAITPDYVISVMEPSPSILQTYLSNVRSKTGDQGAPVTPTEVVE
jgi:hypothetical protein|tara:strand:+ start:1280 stop:1651 length:372 start_codon:yes stop_codon:yes gene_type:complete